MPNLEALARAEAAMQRDKQWEETYKSLVNQIACLFSDRWAEYEPRDAFAGDDRENLCDDVLQAIYLHRQGASRAIRE